jgi:hypothetical protein
MDYWITLMVIGLFLVLCGVAMDVLGDVNGGWHIAAGGGLVLFVSILVGVSDQSSRWELADKHFRSKYEIASPCRLVNVNSCSGGECELVIRCKDGE